jgi:hypothetical protein
MEKYDHGPLQTYEVIYTSGHIEQIQAHQVIMPPSDFFGYDVQTKQEGRWTFHGEFDGRWMLVLSVPESDVKSVRNVTRTADDMAGGA